MFEEKIHKYVSSIQLVAFNYFIMHFEHFQIAWCCRSHSRFIVDEYLGPFLQNHFELLILRIIPVIVVIFYA